MKHDNEDWEITEWAHIIMIKYYLHTWIVNIHFVGNVEILSEIQRSECGDQIMLWYIKIKGSKQEFLMAEIRYSW